MSIGHISGSCFTADIGEGIAIPCLLSLSSRGFRVVAGKRHLRITRTMAFILLSSTFWPARWISPSKLSITPMGSGSSLPTSPSRRSILDLKWRRWGWPRKRVATMNRMEDEPLIPTRGKILTLPEELLIYIGGFLYDRDLLNYTMVSKRIYQISCHSIAFWKHATPPALLDRILPIHQYEPKALHASVRRAANNRLRTSHRIPSQTKTIRINGSVRMGSETLVPESRFMLTLLETSSSPTLQLVCLDLRLGREVARVDTGCHAECCILAVQKTSMHSFRVALAELCSSDEGVCQTQVTILKLDATTAGSTADDVFSVQFTTEYSSIIAHPKSRGEVSCPSELNKMYLQDDLVIIEENYCGSRSLRYVPWKEESKPSTVMPLPSNASSWQVVGDYLLCNTNDGDIYLAGISALKHQIYSSDAEPQMKEMVLAHNTPWLKLCCNSALVAFDQQSVTVYEVDDGEIVTKVPGVFYRQCDEGPATCYFNLVIHSREGNVLKVDLESTLRVSQGLLLEGIFYTNGITVGLGETWIHVASERGDTPLSRLEPIPGLTLGTCELLDAESGALVIGRFESGETEPVSRFDVYWYTSFD